MKRLLERISRLAVQSSELESTPGEETEKCPIPRQ